MANYCKNTEDVLAGLVSFLCVTYAFTAWHYGGEENIVERDLNTRATVAQTTLLPSSIAAGKFLENSGLCEPMLSNTQSRLWPTKSVTTR